MRCNNCWCTASGAYPLWVFDANSTNPTWSEYVPCSQNVEDRDRDAQQLTSSFCLLLRLPGHTAWTPSQRAHMHDGGLAVCPCVSFGAKITRFECQAWLLAGCKRRENISSVFLRSITNIPTCSCYMYGMHAKGRSSPEAVPGRILLTFAPCAFSIGPGTKSSFSSFWH